MDGYSEEACGPARGALSAIVPVTVVYVAIFVSGVVGNASTCVVIARNRSMHTATNFYLFSLAVSDLLMLVAGLPTELYLIWKRYPFELGGAFCFARGLLAETAGNATVLTIVAFTAERYLAICRPFLAQTMSRPPRAARLCVCAWAAALCLAVPQARPLEISGPCDMCMAATTHSRHFFALSTVVFFVVPMALISVLYVLIGLRLRASSVAGGGGARAHGRSSRKVVKMLVAVVVAFFICWAPFHAQRLFSLYCTPDPDSKDREFNQLVYEIITYLSGVLYYFSATVNPILYNIMSAKFREAFKDTFSWCICRSRRDKKPERQYSMLSRSNPRDQNSTDSGKEDATVHTNSTLTPKTSADSYNGQFRRSKRQQGEARASAAVLAPPPRLGKLLRALGCPQAGAERPRAVDVVTAGGGAAPRPEEEEPCRRDVSNSSLKELGGGAIDDELTAYMKELKRREMCG